MTAVVDGAGAGGADGETPKKMSLEEILAAGEAEPPPPPPWWRQFLVFDKDGKLNFDKTMDDLFGIPRHDVTAAKIILIRHQEEFFYIALDDKRGAKGQIRIWNGTIWESDLNDGNVSAWVQQFWKNLRRALDAVKDHIKAVGEQKLAEFLATGLSEDAARKRVEGIVKPMLARLLKFEQYWEGLGRNTNQRALITQMCSERTLVCKDEEFDSVPEFLVVPNGVFDLGVTERSKGTSLDLLPHSSARRVTKMTKVTYRPGVDCPVFKKYLAEVLPDDETRVFLQKALGSALLGKPRDKKMINLIGPTNSGKTVLIEVLQAVMGDYCESVDAQMFTTKKHGKNPDAASPMLHSARLAKMVVASETDPGDRWDSGLLKALTGRDTMHSRNMYGSLAKWTPRFLIVMASNHFVKLDAEDTAIINRIAPIKFPKSFVKPDKDEHGNDIWPEGVPVDQRADINLADRIRESEEEMSGILNWLLEGLQMYLRDGLGETDAIRRERSAMEQDSSMAVQWLEARKEDGIIGVLTREEAALHGSDPGCIVAKKDRLTHGAAYADFIAWCEAEGISEKSRFGKVRFGKEIEIRGSSTGKKENLGDKVMGFDLLYWKDPDRRAMSVGEMTELWTARSE